MTIAFDGQLAWTCVQMLGLFFVLGFAVDVWLRSKLVIIYPAYGLIALSVLSGLFSYIVGYYSTIILSAICAVIIVIGVIGIFLKGIPISKHDYSWRNVLPVTFSIFAYLTFAVIQASKYGIPGGVDSSIHSGIINGILIQAHSVGGTYPLGMHIVVLFCERVFHATQANVFLALYISLQLYCIVGIAYITKAIFSNWLASVFGIIAVLIDVSIFNNYLNGSGTHLFGLFLIIFLVVVMLLTQRLQRCIQVACLTAIFSAIWFIHYPTLFFALPIIWAWFLSKSQRPNWKVLGAFGISLLVSLPIQLKFVHDTAFLHSIIPGLVIIAAIGAILHFIPQIFFEVFKRRWLLSLIALLSLCIFYSNLSTFLFLPTWYGQLGIYIAFLGIGAAIISPRSASTFGLISFAIITITYAVFNHKFAPGQSKVMVELVYYYGFTFSLVLLGTSGLNAIIKLFRRARTQYVLISAIVVYVLLLTFSRTFDQTFVPTSFQKDQPISRYGSSKGFSILYTKNDIALAEWVKIHVPNDGVIYNPGGLYNQWASLTEHQVVLSNYNTATIGNAPMLINEFNNLLQGVPNAQLHAITSSRVSYILLPEKFSVGIFHSQVQLLKQIGNARFYKILRQPNEVLWEPLPLTPHSSTSNLRVVGKVKIECRYCGDAFYFTDKSTLRKLIFNSGTEVTFELAQQKRQITYDLYADHGGSKLAFRTSVGEWVQTQDDILARKIVVPANTRLRFQLKNPDTEQVQVNALALQVVN